MVKKGTLSVCLSVGVAVGLSVSLLLGLHTNPPRAQVKSPAHTLASPARLTHDQVPHPLDVVTLTQTTRNAGVRHRAQRDGQEALLQDALLAVSCANVKGLCSKDRVHMHAHTHFGRGVREEATAQCLLTCNAPNPISKPSCPLSSLPHTRTRHFPASPPPYPACHLSGLSSSSPPLLASVSTSPTPQAASDPRRPP